MWFICLYAVACVGIARAWQIRKLDFINEFLHRNGGGIGLESSQRYNWIKPPHVYNRWHMGRNGWTLVLVFINIVFYEHFSVTHLTRRRRIHTSFTAHALWANMLGQSSWAVWFELVFHARSSNSVGESNAGMNERRDKIWRDVANGFYFGKRYSTITWKLWVCIYKEKATIIILTKSNLYK